MSVIRANYTRRAGQFLAETFTFLNPDGSPRIFDGCTSTMTFQAQAGDGTPLAEITLVPSVSGYIGFDEDGNGWFFASAALLNSLGQISPFIHIVWGLVAADGVTPDVLLTGVVTVIGATASSFSLIPPTPPAPSPSPSPSPTPGDPYALALATDPIGATAALQYLGSLVTLVTWTSKSTGLVVKSQSDTYVGPNVKTEVTRVFGPDGSTVVAQTTETNTYTNGVLTGQDTTRDV